MFVAGKINFFGREKIHFANEKKKLQTTLAIQNRLPLSIQSKLNVWDIPTTDVYANWKKPPGHFGSELRKNKKLGITFLY